MGRWAWMARRARPPRVRRDVRRRPAVGHRNGAARGRRIVDAGGFKGAVIDVGCGTGENALELSARGSPVVGVDASPRAIEKARAKALERGSSAEFLVADAFSLDALGRRFDTALDCGVFHVFEDRERPAYVAEPGLGAGARGCAAPALLQRSPARETWVLAASRSRELRDSFFAEGWDVVEIVATAFVANLPGGGAGLARHHRPSRVTSGVTSFTTR